MTYQVMTTWHTDLPRQTLPPQHKVVLLGMAGVGKTAYFLRVRDDVFKEPPTTCNPADYLRKAISLPEPTNSDISSVTILLYDTAGGEKFRSLTSNFFRNAHAAILMFSLDDSVSFDKMELEVQNAQLFINKDFLWVVVGNKSDLKRDPHITDERVEAFCSRLGSRLWVYISVKTGLNVDEVLKTVAAELYRKHHHEMSQSESYSDTVKLVSTDTLTDESKLKTCRTRLENCGT